MQSWRVLVWLMTCVVSLAASTSCALFDNTPPTISELTATEITGTTARITWGTDEATSSEVEYGTTPSYGKSAVFATTSESHDVILTGLKPDTTYHYVVRSTDRRGNKGVSPDRTFSTLWVGPNGETEHETVTYDGDPVEGADGHQIALENNRGARNVTWEELKQFLQTDQTEELPYDDNTFVCADFAERLHNNAERAGIRAAYVCIDFGPSGLCNLPNWSTGCGGYCGGGHACNAFQTTDNGLIFVDDTGTDEGTENDDCTVIVVQGQEYTPESIFSEAEWCPMGQVHDFKVNW